jgi:hypothetical protein
VKRCYTDPYTVMALVNQPLREERLVDDVVVFDGKRLGGLRRRVGAWADRAGMIASPTCSWPSPRSAPTR